MKKCKDNKGFSLVELIIVIAIMAVLIGVLAPLYLKYVEKSRISSDAQLVDAICKSITYASTDPKIREDAQSDALITSMASQAIPLEDLETTNNSLADEVKDVMGWSDLSRATYQAVLKSKHTSASTIYVQNRGTMNTPFIVWISYTNKNGRGSYLDATDKDDIGDCICVN